LTIAKRFRAILSAVKLLTQTAICTVILSFLGAGCKGKPIEPRGPTVRKAGSATTPSGCLAGFINSVTLSVRGIHFRNSCQKHSGTGEYVWTYMFRDDAYTGDAISLEGCMDTLATSLNDNVPFMDIGLNDRCTKRVKVYSTERYMWAYEYSGVL
jgi:hypothetical protein